MWSHQGRVTESFTSLDRLHVLFSMHLQCTIGLPCQESSLLAHGQPSCPPEQPGPPPQNCSPNLYSCMRLLLLHLSLLNLKRFPSLCNSPVGPGLTEWQHRLSVHHPLLLATSPSANLQRVHFILSPRSLMKILNKTRPSTTAWGRLLATNLHYAPLITTL